ncbi:MAG: SUMF1/EgtB/PvdO family nonheme iron enzyme, partial [Desulfobacteraceae bacterium]
GGAMAGLKAMVRDLAGSMGLDTGSGPGREFGEGEGLQADAEVVEILEDSEDAEEEPEELDENEVLEEVEAQEEPWDEIEEIPEGLDEETDPEEIEGEIEEEEEFGETEVAEVLEEEEPEEEPLSEEDPEEIDEDEILEEVEGEGREEASSLDGQILDIDGGGEVDVEKNRLLAEEFNQSLAAMDRFYNQHIWIPGGEYRVGSPSPSTGERPEAAVLVEDFYIGKFPVTNALFELFVEKTGYRTTAEKAGFSIVHQGRFRRRIDERTGKKEIICRSGISTVRVEGACWYQPTGPGSSLRHKRNHPVVHVSLEDALAFAAWCGKRLPTEEEWEAAMRTGSGLRYPWGDEWTGSACNMEKAFLGDTSAVDRYIEYENPLGVADALGNVLEWTITMEKGGRVLKGGSWLSKDGVPLWYRKVLPAEAGSNITGFRCVAF